MSIAHQMRQQRRNAVQERRSLIMGSTIVGGCVLTVVGAVAMVIAHRGLATDQDEMELASSEEFKTTKPVRRAGDRVRTADADNPFIQQCKRNMMIGGLGAMAIGSPHLQGERGREIGRKMIDGSMCDEAFATMRQMQDLHRRINKPSSDDE